MRGGDEGERGGDDLPAVQPQRLESGDEREGAVREQADVGNAQVVGQGCLQFVVVVPVVREPFALPDILQKLRKLLQRGQEGGGYGDGLLLAVRRVRHGLSTVFVHLLVVFLVIAGGDVFHPLAVIEGPTDGFFNALLELERGLPAELVLELGGVDGVAQVMPGAVGYVGDEVITRAGGVAQQAIYRGNDDADEVDVLPLIEPADVVGVPNLATVENGIDGAGVVFYVQPITDILALAVHGQGLAGADVVDEEGDELLRELVGTVIVRAIGH